MEDNTAKILEKTEEPKKEHVSRVTYPKPIQYLPPKEDDEKHVKDLDKTDANEGDNTALPENTHIDQTADNINEGQGNADGEGQPDGGEGEPNDEDLILEGFAPEKED